MDFWIVTSFEFFLFVFLVPRYIGFCREDTSKTVELHNVCVFTSLYNAKVLSKVVLTIYLTSNARRGFLILRTGGDHCSSTSFQLTSTLWKRFPAFSMREPGNIVLFKMIFIYPGPV